MLLQELFNSEPVMRRVPKPFEDMLKMFWEARFRNKLPQPYYMHHQYDNYEYKDGSIIFSLEQLRQADIIANNAFFSLNGSVNLKASSEICRSLFAVDNNPGVLAGLNIAVVGGHEGDIFALLGADAISIDPKLESILPPPVSPNNKDISQALDIDLALEYKDYFDLTFSQWLFDIGSGLIEDGGDQQLSYGYYFNLILLMTRKGGISVHNGDMVGDVVNMKDPRYRVLSYTAFSDFSNSRDQSNLVAIQKIV